MPLQEPVACHSTKSHMTSAVFSTFFSVCLTSCTALSSDRLSHYQRDLNKYDRSVAMTQAVAGFLSPHSRHHLMGAPLRLEQVMVPSLVIIGLPCHSATHSADVLKSGCTHDNRFSVEKQEQNLQTKKKSLIPSSVAFFLYREPRVALGATWQSVQKENIWSQCIILPAIPMHHSASSYLTSVDETRFYPAVLIMLFCLCSCYIIWGQKDSISSQLHCSASIFMK